MLYSINFHPVGERATRFQFLITCYIQVQGDGYLVFSTDVPLDKDSPVNIQVTGWLTV